jgi:phosphatidylglycerophosphate synthase
MIVAGYLVVILLTNIENSNTHLDKILFILAPLIPVIIIVAGLLKGNKPGKWKFTMLILTSGFALFYYLVSMKNALYILLFIVTSLTVLSGVSYLADAWAAFKGKPGSIKEAARFILEGIIVPTAFLLPLSCFKTGFTSALIILGITMELSAGGLGNLLASRKIKPRFRLIVLKSTLEVLFAVSAFAICKTGLFNGTKTGTVLIAGASLVAVIFATISFVKHKKIYLGQIKST